LGRTDGSTGRSGGGGRTDDELDDLVVTHVAHGRGGCHPAVTQDGHAVGDLPDGCKIVRDEDDARSGGHHPPDEIEQELDLVLRQEHRRFIENENR